MEELNLHISRTTLNINGKNISIERQKLVEWIKKDDPTICCVQATFQM